MPSGLDAPSLRDLRWLMGALTLVAAINYGVLVATDSRFREPLPLIAFTVLLVTHLVLHWLLLRLSACSSWVPVYFLAQGPLFLGVTLLSSSPTLVFSLSACLIGEAVGTLGLSRRGLLAGGYFIVLVIISFILMYGWRGSLWWVVGTVAVAGSSALNTHLFKHQAEARQRAQSLLRDLEAANGQLTEYAARVEDLTIEAERQRMARELHDTLSQGLAGLVLQLEAVSAHLKVGRPERALAIVDEAMGRARGTLADSRRAIADLRQDGSPDLGELARQEAARFSSSTGLPCSVEVALSDALPEEIAEAARRVLVEGLTNVARHARASRVDLRVAAQQDPKHLDLEICDDGIGFDPESVHAGHFGLLGMRERVGLVGGRLEVCSTLGKGTRLVVRFPLEDCNDG